MEQSIGNPQGVASPAGGARDHGKGLFSASASRDGTVRLWHLDVGATIASVHSHTGEVRDLLDVIEMSGSATFHSMLEQLLEAFIRGTSDR